MAKQTLSVVLPNYNYSKFIKTSLQALLNQTRKPDKLIIIDDGSTDNSLAVIEDLIKDVPYVLLLKNSTNMGIIYSIKKALSFVTTDYLFFTASDDVISCDYINEMMKFVEEHLDIGLCCSIPAFFRNSNNIWADDFNINTKKIFEADESVKLIKKTRFWIATHASIIKTSEIKKEPSDEILKYYSDWYTVLNIAFKNKIGFIPKPLAFMRIHDTSYSGKKKKYRDSKEMFSFLMNKINNEHALIKEKFIQSRALSSLDNNLIIFLLLKVKYWKYLRGIVCGKFLRFFIKLMRKIKKLFFYKIKIYNFENIKSILEKNKSS